jgi:outer membrane protein OmpA-like peptidoglycan-associated protein
MTPFRAWIEKYSRPLLRQRGLCPVSYMRVHPGDTTVGVVHFNGVSDMTHTKQINRKLFSGATLCAVAASVVLAGCQGMSPTARDTAIGAGVGAAAGGLLGDGKGAAIGAGVGALGGYIWSQHMENKKREMERVTAGTGVQVEQTPDNQLRLNIPNDISFDTNSAVIKPHLQPILNQFAQGLGSQPNTEVLIVGHTDSTGNDAINNPLSQRRADSARDYLISRGANGSLIRTEGRGSRQPIADNATEAGRAKNRRIEIFLAERAPAQQPVQQPQQPPAMNQPIGQPMQR